MLPTVICIVWEHIRAVDQAVEYIRVRERRLGLATGHTLAVIYIVRGFSPLRPTTTW